MLNKEEIRKYIRQIMLPGVGNEGQEKIRKAAVLVVGAGGLGCPVIQYLAAAGIGKLGIVDFDTVNITNIHRQILYGNEDVGRFKTEVSEEKISRQYPEVQVQLHPVQLDAENGRSIIAAYDIVVDGCDNFATRYLVNDLCCELNKPLVYGSILGFQGQLAVFNLNGSKHLRDLFPESPDPEDVPDCSENGVLATVPGIMGSLMAHECLKLILGKHVLCNKYLVYDTENHQQNIIHY